jgi:hypothetical protein
MKKMPKPLSRLLLVRVSSAYSVRHPSLYLIAASITAERPYPLLFVETIGVLV